jgi:uncharacterized membrane protein YvbJ
MVKWCPKDGSAQRDDQTICRYCGTPLDVPGSQKKTIIKLILFLILFGLFIILAMSLLSINYSSIGRYILLAFSILCVVLLGSFIKTK